LTTADEPAAAGATHGADPVLAAEPSPAADPSPAPADLLPPLRVHDPPEGRSDQDQAIPGRQVPAAIDLASLEARVDWLSVGPESPEPVLVIELTTRGGGEQYPPGAFFEAHIDFGPATGESGDVVLSARLSVPRPGARRRHAPGTGTGRPSVLRFSGPGDLGGYSSMVPGHSVTYRLPAAELLATIPAERQEAARGADGTWTVHLWAVSSLAEGTDRIPDEGRAAFRFSLAPPDGP
jgi:hypothetical protein